MTFVCVFFALVPCSLLAASGDINALRRQVADFHAAALHQAAVDAIGARLAQVDNTESAEAAELLLMQGDAQMKAGFPKLAFTNNEQAWRLRERLFGASDRRTLEALTEYLEACALVGTAKTCEAQAADAVKQYEALGDPIAPGLAAMLRTHALLTAYVGRNAAAVVLLERAIHIWGQNGTSFEQNVLDGMSSKAILLLNLSREREALTAVDELLPRQKALLGDRAPHVLVTLLSRASILSRMGRLDEALVTATETVRLRTETLTAEHQDTMAARLTLGTIQLKMGRIAEAAATLGGTAEALERVSGTSNADAIEARYLQAVALRQGGLHQQSVDLLTRVVDEHARVWTEKQPVHGSYLAALATSLQSTGDVDGALIRIDRAVELGIAIRGPTHISTLVRRLTALSIRERAGLSPKATDVKQIIDSLTEKFGSDHPEALAARHLYAVLLGRQGSVDEALLLMRAVAETQTRMLGAAHVEAMRSQAALSRLLVKAQRQQEALTILDELLPRVHSLRRSVALFGPAAQRQIVEQFHPYLAERVVLLARFGRLEEAFVAMEDCKARTLLDQLARQRAFAGVDLPPELTDRLQRLSARHVSFEANVGVETRAEPREALLESLRNTHVELEASLAEAIHISARFSSLLDVATATAGDLSLIGNHAALVHFLRGFDDNWYAMVSSPSGTSKRKLNWVELGQQSGLNGNVEALRIWASAHQQRFATDDRGRPMRIYRVRDTRGSRWLVRSSLPPCEADAERASCLPSGAREVNGEDEFAALRQHLGEQLLTPLLPAIGDAKRVLISPDGALGLLPWDTLHVKRESTLRRWTISVTPSLSVLKTTLERDLPPERHALLAFAASEGGMVEGEFWPPLRHAENEASAAVALFRNERALAFIGKQATESNLRQLAASGELSRYRRVLIAAHGRFNSARPAANAVLLAADGTSPQTDGVVSVADWISMPLNSDLVVLSACETARGQLVAGEGLVGFSYALNVAGNRALLATLWPVNDRPAAEFVLEFLRQTKRGIGHAAALNQTKRVFAQHTDSRRNSPRVWGAFVLVGV